MRLTVTSQDIESLFHQELKYAFQALLILRRQSLDFFVAIGATVFFGWVAVMFLQSNNWIGGLICLALAVCGVLIVKKRRPPRGVRPDAVFRNFIMKPLLERFGPTWAYSSHGPNMRPLLEGSGWFSRRMDFVNSGDYIVGKSNDRLFMLAQVDAGHFETVKDKNGHTFQKSVVDYSSSVAVAEFSSSFQGWISLVPDRFEKILGGALVSGDLFGRESNLVRLENPEFERLYKVRTNNEILARQILTPLLMESIVQVMKGLENPLRLAFIDGNLLISVDDRAKTQLASSERSEDWLLYVLHITYQLNLVQDVLSALPEVQQSERSAA